jgi:hypothetical protein
MLVVTGVEVRPAIRMRRGYRCTRDTDAHGDTDAPGNGTFPVMPSVAGDLPGVAFGSVVAPGVYVGMEGDRFL